MPFTIAISYSFYKIADFYCDERFVVNYIFRVTCDKIDEVPWNLNFSTSIKFYKTIDCGYLCDLIILSYPTLSNLAIKKRNVFVSPTKHYHAKLTSTVFHIFLRITRTLSTFARLNFPRIHTNSQSTYSFV